MNIRVSSVIKAVAALEELYKRFQISEEVQKETKMLTVTDVQGQPFSLYFQFHFSDQTATGNDYFAIFNAYGELVNLKRQYWDNTEGNLTSSKKTELLSLV